MINQWYVYKKCTRTGYASNWSLIEQTGSSFIKWLKLLSPIVEKAV